MVDFSFSIITVAFAFILHLVRPGIIPTYLDSHKCTPYRMFASECPEP